jgi:GNAT superfamily N-acetyltransferase
VSLPRISFNPSPVERAVIDEKLGQYNQSASSLHQVQDLSLAITTESGNEVLGGLVGRTWGACAEIQQLWVHANLRKQGYGSRLLEAFVSEARHRACKVIYLETFSFQAPSFYQAHGFVVVHELGGFAPGTIKYWMQRNL